jgi:hypothetical protein
LPLRRIASILALLAIAGMFAFVEAHAVWGYAVQLPSLRNDETPWGRVTAISQLDFTSGLLPHVTRQQMVQWALTCQQRPSVCWEPAWVLTRALEAGLSDETPEVPKEVWEPVWETELIRQRVVSWRAGEWQSVQPAGGIAVQLRWPARNGCYLSTPLPGDATIVMGMWRPYTGWKNRLEKPNATLISEAHYFCDNDRLPQLWFSVLFELNAMALFVGIALVHVARNPQSHMHRLLVASGALLLILLVVRFTHGTLGRFDSAFHDLQLAFGVGAIADSALPALSLYYVTRRMRDHPGSSPGQGGDVAKAYVDIFDLRHTQS